MRLILFNHSAVHEDGTTDPFMVQEWKWLKNHFDSVTVVCEKGIAELGDDPSTPLALSRPLFSGIKACIMLLFRKEFWTEANHLKRDDKLNIVNIARLLRFTFSGLKMSQFLGRIQGDILYSFWMYTDAYAMSIAKKKQLKCQSFFRCHAFDIDPERNPLNPYLMKKMILNENDYAFPISEVAKYQLGYCCSLENLPPKVLTMHMGSTGNPESRLQLPPRFIDHCIHIVTCARLSPIKQIAVLADVLSQWEGSPVTWIHIGAGEEYEKLCDRCDKELSLKENVSVTLIGDLTPDEVEALYQTYDFDVIINTSKMEGTPVSIMEAMRFGIPAIAPNVGGIGELINENNGWLYEPGHGIESIAGFLELLNNQTPDEALSMRNSCQVCWKERFCSDNQLEKIFSTIGRNSNK